MNIIQKFESLNRPLVSVEFFPPKSDAAVKTFERSAEELVKIKPDFISVTCGAGGSVAGPTLGVCQHLSGLGYDSIMPHCTCVGMSESDLGKSSDAIVGSGLAHIMALRGDPPKGEENFTAAENGFSYASELVSFLRDRHPNLCLGVAGYPEKHPEANSLSDDIAYLKQKVDAGADFITTQLFLDNRVYFDFVDKCRKAGIDVPILPGLLPVTSLKQMERTLTFSDSYVPEKLRKDLENAQGDAAKSERIGLYWAIEQISELIEGGAPGIHLYLLNRAQTAFYPELFACLSRVRNMTV